MYPFLLKSFIYSSKDDFAMVFILLFFLLFSYQLNLDHAMPTGSEMFSAIIEMKVLTPVLTNSLGSYESSYLNAMDNEGRSFVRKFISFLN